MFHLIEPDLGRVSGGLQYNRDMVDAAGQQFQRHQLAGSWPAPTDTDIAALYALIEDVDQPILIDGLIGCSLSQPVEVAVPVVQLVHAIAETETAKQRERDCLLAADAVVTTSHFAASVLDQRYGLNATVAPPGLAQRPQSVGDDGCHLICVGAIEPNKNQLFLAQTLGRLVHDTDAIFHCTFAGPRTDLEYADQVDAALARLPGDRFDVVGELNARELSDLYHSADLLLLPSRREAFGMVVREAAAAGVPALVTAETGAEEALAAGHALALDEYLWSVTLQRWLTDTAYRTDLQRQARQARQQLEYGWEPTATTILQVMDEVA